MNHVAPESDDIGRDWIKTSTEAFAEKVRSSDFERLLWIAPQSACEQCGLQWYFERFPDAPAGPMIIVDSPPIPGWRNGPPLGLGELPADVIAGLLDGAPRSQWPRDLSSPKLWKSLRAEDSLLRVVEEGRLRSVQTNYFDAVLVEQTSSEWCSWTRSVGNAMIEAGERGHNISAEYLTWRVRELIRQGCIQCEGELPGPQHDEKHRPNAILRLVSE
jgi:hypothetical protein